MPLYTPRPSIVLCPSSVIALNPADATTYYFGAVTQISVEGYNRIYFHRPARITGVRLAIVVLGTLGTTEQATISVRKNATTDTTVVTTAQYDQIGPTRFDNTAMEVSVVGGDWVEMKVVMPTFVTNPTSVYHVTELLVVWGD